MKRILVFIFFFIVVSDLFSNTPFNVPPTFIKTHVSRIQFTPLVANPFEGRVGAMYQFEDNKLRLDIGNSLDLFYLGNGINAGVDFFTFTRLRSEGNFKFPVETSDYFFGVNVSSRSFLSFLEYTDFDSGNDVVEGAIQGSFRLRFAHISSHLVDGLSDTTGKLEKKPFVYSREFADLVIAIESVNFRGYGGFTGIWATQPRNITRIIPQFGLEYKYLLANGIDAFAGYDFKLVGVDNIYIGTNAWQAGVKFYQYSKESRLQDSPAISLNIYGYHGRSMHGMFYKDMDSYIGTGFQFMF